MTTAKLKLRILQTHEGRRAGIPVVPLPLIRPAPMLRDWMDGPLAFSRFCTPLKMASAYGWEVLAPCDISVAWNGGPAAADLIVQGSEDLTHVCDSHIGQGMLSFNLPFLIKAPRGWDVMITGPLSAPKPGLYPISGLVEADWNFGRLSMSYRVTVANLLLRWTKGEPIAQFFPVRRADLERFELELDTLSSEHTLHDRFWRHQSDRGLLISRIRAGQSVPRPQRQGFLHVYNKHAKRQSLKVATPVDRRV